MFVFNCQIINSSINRRRVLSIFKRFRSKAQLKEKYSPCKKALKHFDDFYESVFGERWPSIRLALFSKPKYFAVINNFGDVKETEEYLQELGAFELKDFLKVQKEFVEKSTKTNETQNKNKTELGDIIQQQLLQEEEKEAQYLHPDGLEFKARVDSSKQEKDEDEETKDSSYNPEDARTSLDSDLKMSQIDKNRLIMPNSKTDSTMLHEFIPATQLRGTEEYVAESDYYKYYKVKSTSLLSFEEEHEIEFPENLKVFTFDRGEILDFPYPIKNSNNIYNYLKIDGSDLLATLALDIQYEDAVLDLCSTSPNISFCVLQALKAKVLFCASDVKHKTYNLFSQYLLDSTCLWEGMPFISSTFINEDDYKCHFDKVLIDVPCTFDRTALLSENDNMFHNAQTKNRLKLPETQCSLLLKGMKLVRPGGTVVYTTSTLSPIQNDGVVSEALKNIWESDNIKFTVKNLSPAIQHMSLFFNFDKCLNLKFGTLVVPFVPSNFGPRYICKIVRNEEKVEGNDVE